MSLKRFNADVRAARERLHETAIPGVAAIERGDSEGEVVVTFVHEESSKPLPIRVLAQNVDEYPDGNNFLLFIDSDDVAGNITATLEELQNFTFGQKLLEAIITLSSGIQRVLNNVDSEGNINMDGMKEPYLSEGEDDDDDEPYDDFDDSDDDDLQYDQFGLAALRPRRSIATLRMTSVVLRRIRRDLRKAREAGCKVGIIGGLDNSSRTHVISLSVRANKLGLSQEALEAWDVEASDYIVLMIRIEDLYPCSEKVVQHPSVDFHIQFRFGKCARYKPSLEQAFAAFATTAQKLAGEDKTPSAENDDQRFQKIFISTSLEQFMNESFISLVKLRFRDYKTWDDANTELRNLSSISCDDQAKGNGQTPTAHKSAENSKKAVGSHSIPGNASSGQ